jgi:Fe-S oxidoreductase
MMSTRDRIEEIGQQREANGGKWEPDGKTLLGDWITEEELWACTSCQACVDSVFGKKQEKAISKKELRTLRKIIDEEIEKRSAEEK